MAHDTTVEAAVAAASAASASKGMWTGAAVGALGGVSHNALIGWAGVLIALAGLLMNWYYRHLEYKLRKRQIEKGDA